MDREEAENSVRDLINASMSGDHDVIIELSHEILDALTKEPEQEWKDALDGEGIYEIKILVHISEDESKSPVKIWHGACLGPDSLIKAKYRKIKEE